MRPFSLFSIVPRTRLFFQRVREIEKSNPIRAGSKRDVIEVAANAAYHVAMDAADAAYEDARIAHARAFNAAIAAYDTAVTATEHATFGEK